MSGAPPKLALVTGGCRRVGAAISAYLARQGWALALHGHSDCEPDKDLVGTLADTGAEWHGFVAELSDPEACNALISQVTEHFGRVPDLLVNNASLFEYDTIDSLTAHSLAAHFAVNAHAPVVLTKKLVDLAGGGMQPCVVHIADQRVRNPNGDQLSYTLSKQALVQSVQTLAIAYGRRARINAVAPGLILPTEEYGADQIRTLANMMPLEKLAAPEDIAVTVHYLAEAASVTGQIVYVDAGAHLTHFARDFVFMGK